MVNMIENVKQEIREVVEKALVRASGAGEIPPVQIQEVEVEIPREKDHGDFSTNVAMQVTKLVRKPPRQTAEIIIKNLSLENTYIERVECAGPGFINFHLNNNWLFDTLKAIQAEGENYGRISMGEGKKVMVEFVSANPTGPLHMGNARGGALGDCIASVLEAAGFDVTREFYINDAGNQIEKFGISLEARYIQLLKGEDAVPFPEDGYHGEDIVEHMRNFIAQNGDRLLNLQPLERRRELVKYALEKNLEKMKNDLESYGITYDVWFSEQSLYDSGELQETLDYLQDKGYTFEKDGALWFKASQFGAEKDEVIIRNNGIPTYFASDIAYHRNKFIKRGFDRVIDLLGADHHGHVARMKGAVAALGIDADKLDIVIFQLVRLYRNGEIARMSKRTGKAISLADLLEEVGRDAARFIFNTKASGSHLDFDLDLAVQQSNDNPVFYVQYAHARICSLLRLLEEDGIQVPEASGADLTLLQKKEEIELLKKLAELPEEIRIAAQTLEPSRLTRYVQDVASLFHSFYNACRVKGEEEGLMKARLVLVDATRTVIRNVLGLIKISAPERM
ncbi:MAG: arginine--tRNA ligase [Clostridiales bacterium]|jgi:arginyl-tRNA synthetase|nr:arginine--tRNA ligase [Eubacteriales bacterium]MDH7566462.1 arginine--tRNA ligase [Clostridiales bacterium]